MPAPILPGLRARYPLLRFLRLPSRGGWCGGRRGARTHLTSFSFRAFRFATRSPGGCRGRCPHRPVAEASINHQASGSENRRGMYPRLPRAKGLPRGSAFPSLTAARDRQPSPAGGRRSALARTDPPNIFSFPPGAAHFLFDVSKRKWGRICQPSAWLSFRVQWDAPQRPQRELNPPSHRDGYIT